ncbi:hypothetical protein EEB14_45300 [Rhodococcus sp. WS4]|nr:hypothetical protein EEB14_45300 [Rhodococcus sp. WS4]
MTAAGVLPLLLRTAPRYFTAPATSLDIQSRIGRPDGSPADANPCVVVLTRAVDREMDELSLWLAAHGTATVRIDTDRCSDTDVRWDPVTGILDWDGDRLRPQVCWLRYFDPEAATISGHDDSVAHYAREQWAAWASTMMGHDSARRINPRARTGVPDRITQLRAARAVGLRTPATVVTSRLMSALPAIPGTGDLLVKALGRHKIETEPGYLRGVFPQRVGRAAVAAETAVEPAPVMVQEYLPSDGEFRIYVVGGRLIAYRVTRPTPDALWTTPSAVAVEPCDVDPALAQALRRLTTRFDLDIAAFDLLDTPEGPVFLEVNPECDWLWADHAAGTTATSAAVRELVLELLTTNDTEDHDD